MLSPQVLAPRGVYEASFYVRAVGALFLCAVRSNGVLLRTRVVRTDAEYAEALLALTAALDADDPPPTLALVD